MLAHPTLDQLLALDLDIQRAAHQWIAKHGDQATAMARQMVEWMQPERRY